MSEKLSSDPPADTHDQEYNRLIHEKSPYLLQHAHNPVDWYPWGSDAFTRAKTENKPVFLSIGYSTCHWCHVMAHESFEDRDVAALLNRDFICIKVDREERPDIDSTYMAVCQMMTGQGGWPLTVIMTPEKKPFFAGTYIPKKSRFGITGLMDLIPRISGLWHNQQKDLIATADTITAALQKLPDSPSAGTPGSSLLNQGYEELSQRFDPESGGFGRAPKFPVPCSLLFLLRFWKRTGTTRSLAMVEKTLHDMRFGGIYDQIGFGFHRYSTDAQWRIPHFEKMLYDQALLVMAYTEAYQATHNPDYRSTAEEIISYAIRDLKSADGAFYSAEDADSSDGEGAFYLWTEREIATVLGKDDARLAARLFNVTQSGNYQESGSGTGKNILYRSNTVSSSPGLENIESTRSRLFQARSQRSRPALDDKVLADGNGLFIAALAQAARTFRNEGYLTVAEKAMEFILTRMRDSKGGLMHRYRDNEGAIPGFGDDYAFIVKALIELYESSLNPYYLMMAIELNTGFLAHFWDDEKGGFFSTSEDAEILFIRKKDLYDGAVPSCNSVAFENLVRLAHLTGNSQFDERAAELSRYFSSLVHESPSAYSGFLCALDLALGPSNDVVITGERLAEDTREMLEALGMHYLPHVMILYRPPGESDYPLNTLSPFTINMKAVGGKATAYVCSGTTCAIPTTDPHKMLELMGVLQS
jgi:uncharacterized protein YyaL (SSP411 family)